MATITLSDFVAGKFLVMATRNGIVKKTPLEQFEKVRSSGIIAITIAPDDELAWVDVATGKDDVIVARSGQDRPLPGERGSAHGSPAAASSASGCQPTDHVVGMSVVQPTADLSF